jgi:hypothetical protein
MRGWSAAEDDEGDRRAAENNTGHQERGAESPVEQCEVAAVDSRLHGPGAEMGDQHERDSERAVGCPDRLVGPSRDVREVGDDTADPDADGE